MLCQDVSQRYATLVQQMTRLGYGAVSPTIKNLHMRGSAKDQMARQASIADLLQACKLSSDVNAAVNKTQSGGFVATPPPQLSFDQLQCRELVDLETLNTKQAKRIASRRAARGISSPLGERRRYMLSNRQGELPCV